MSDDPKLARFQTSYANILTNEIGQDTIDSQKAYAKHVKNDNSIRYIDRQIEGNYANQYGLSLTRMKGVADKLPATNSTQNIGIEESDLENSIVSMR